ncbi:hypothetical protein B566_EDAN007669 [Ephemera danica]|nr:hypothetical protein B566_EDAN007669 [Ephemera danica]
MSNGDSYSFCAAVHNRIKALGKFSTNLVELESKEQRICISRLAEGPGNVFWTSARSDGCPKKHVWCGGGPLTNWPVKKIIWGKNEPNNLNYGGEYCARLQKEGLVDYPCVLVTSRALCQKFEQTKTTFYLSQKN